MGFFKKKNKAEEAAVIAKDPKLKVLECLNQKLNGTLYDNCIIMPRGFTIDVQMVRNEVKDDIHLISVIYIIKNDDLDEPIIDPVDSQGRTEDEAIQMSVDIFNAGIWMPIQQSTQKKNPVHLSIDFMKQHYDFDMYAQSIVRIGVKNDGEATPLISFIKEEIPKFLGSKKYYWIRIFLAKLGDREVVEVRINGTVCATLHAKFKEYIASWNNTSFRSEKQCLIFVQREDDKCPFNKEIVVNAAKQTIALMEELDSAEAYQEMMKKIEEMTGGNRTLAAEIRIFIPEILAKLTMGYQEGDSLFLMTEEGNIEFKKTQLRSYFYIQQAVLSYLQQKPPKEKVMKIVAGSVAYRELRKAHEAGHEPKDLFVPGTSYKIADPNYRIW